MENIRKFLQDIKADLERIEAANNRIADSIFEMEGVPSIRPATEEELQEHVDTQVSEEIANEVSEDMKIALTQCDPFNFN